MEIRLNSAVKTPIKISKVELTLVSGVLVIEVSKPNVVPIWTWNGKRIEGKPTPRTRLPKLLLAKITDIKVVEMPDQPPHDAITLSNLKQFRMYYNQ
jgi:hypothetical protein